MGGPTPKSDIHDLPAHHARLLKSAAWAALSTALLLLTLKFMAWLATGSAAVLGATVDSGMDILASGINLFAIRHALQPADHNHRFGHGKAEPLAGLAQTLIITASGAMLGMESIHRLNNPEPVQAANLGMAVMVFSIIVTLLLVTFQARVVAATGSTAIKADSLHYRGDLALHASVVVSLLITTRFDLLWVDAVFGMGIGLWLMYGAAQIGWESIQLLMDRELPDEDRERIAELVLEHPKVLGMHHLRTRSAGRNTFIQLHIEMDGSLTLDAAHIFAHQVEDKLRRAFPGADVFIHQEPPGIEEEHPDPPDEVVEEVIEDVLDDGPV